MPIRSSMFSPLMLAMAAVACEAVVGDAATGSTIADSPTAAGTAKKPDPAVEKVTFSDGRVVEFVGKRRMLKETFITKDEAGNVTSVVTRFDFKNGKTITFDVLASGLAAELAGHGAEQKIGDETAGVTDVEEMYLSVEDAIKRLSSGQFYKEKGEGFSGVPALARAVHEYQTSQGKDRTLEWVTEFIKSKTVAERAAVKLHPQIKAILDRMEAEKAAKAGNIDAQSVLNAL